MWEVSTASPMSWSRLWHVCGRVFNLSITSVLQSLKLGLCIICQNAFCPLPTWHRCFSWIPHVIFVCCSSTACCRTLWFGWPWLVRRVGFQPCWINSEGPSEELLGEGWLSYFQNKEADTTSGKLSIPAIWYQRISLLLPCFLQAAVRSRMFFLGHGSHHTSANMGACRFPLHTALWPRLQAELAFATAHVVCCRSCRLAFHLVAGPDLGC